ncbi:MAG: hypothetical protein Q8K30_03655 [Candidatus Gracilibacteria bacterium]|nr:hypothetical protein [Candidatus Gracilibacteria bacterium]
MKKSDVNELMVGKFQGGENFGFFIPTDRDYYGGDFYVRKENFGLAQDGDKVEARELVVSKGKKPEAKIIKAFGREPQKKPKFVEGIYSGGEGNFGFIDVEGNEKGFFVYGKKKNGAKDGDKVKAEIVDFNGKKEAIVVKIFKTEEEVVIGRYNDKESFGFVIPEKVPPLTPPYQGGEQAPKQKEEKKWTTGDIFIAGSRKNGANTGDRVEVKIIKKGGKNPEGIILKIIN